MLKISACVVGAVILTLPAIALRALAACLQGTPYTYVRKDVREIGQLINNTFTLLSQNICCVPAGYSLTNGGAAPWRQRINMIIQKVLEQNADVVTLSEVLDYEAALRLIVGLRIRYAHIYYNIGAQGFGPSSGLFVASKFPLRDPNFVQFPREMLEGRTKLAAKGIFAANLPDGTRLYTTHLQPSEIPSQPTLQERAARNLQRSAIIENINLGRSVLTGGLSLDRQEFNGLWTQDFIMQSILKMTLQLGEVINYLHSWLRKHPRLRVISIMPLDLGKQYTQFKLSK